MPRSTDRGVGRVPAMSIVVMGYRNEATIAASIASVIDQVADEPAEVIVVTSGGDRSGNVVRSAFPAIELLEAPERLMPGGARNAGVADSAGEFVAFLAADCVAAPGWLDARLRAHRAGYAAVAGAVANAGPDRPWARAALFLGYRQRLPMGAGHEVAWPHPAAHSLSYSRDLLEEVGSFDPRISIGEDTEMARILAERGVAVWFEPRATIGHHGPISTRALIRDQYRRGAQYVEQNRIDRPGSGTAASILAVEAARWWRAVRGSTAAGIRYDGWRAVVAVPWILLGAAALRFGRFRAFRREG